MLESTENKVIERFKKAKRGTVFFKDDFLRFGTAKNISKTLELCLFSLQIEESLFKYAVT